MIPDNDPEGPRQLPLELGHAVRQSRDDLIVTPTNRDAIEIVDRWPNWPSFAVVLAGPPGSGKSHMAAIWQARTGATTLDPARLAAPVPSGQAVLVDDADRGPLDEAGLFHLLNALRAGGGSLLLTARSFPAAWGVRLPDLASRLRAATTVEIHEPDDLLLAGVITKLFADRQVEVEPNVVQFLVRRIERSLSTAIRVVDRLDRMALERQTRIGRALAAQAIGALDRGQSELDL